MINLDEQHSIESVIPEPQVIEVDRPLFYVRQATIRQPCDPTVLTEFLECLVVEEQNVPLWPDQVTDKLAVIAVAGQNVSHTHLGAEIGKSQNVGWMIDCVAR
jgi:hypothetical protein